MRTSGLRAGFAILGTPAISQDMAGVDRFGTSSLKVKGLRMVKRIALAIEASITFAIPANARLFAVFSAAMIGISQSANAASVIEFEVGDVYYDPDWSSFLTFYFDENKVYYDGASSGQIAKIYKANIFGHDVGEPLIADSYITLHDRDTSGRWSISLDVWWDYAPYDYYGLVGSPILLANDRSPPNLLVEGSWRADPYFYEDNGVDFHEDLYFLHAFWYEYPYDYHVDGYLYTKNVSIFSVPEVPEPTTWTLLLLGFGAVGWGIRRQKPKLALSPA